MQLNLLLATIVLLALLGAGEWLARRSIRRGRYYVFPPGKRERLWLHRESHPQLEPVVRRMINAQGERGRPVPTQGDVFRVLVVGGSAAECFTLDQETQWPAVLETRLRSPEALRHLAADDAHVGNIGRSGVDSGSLDVILARVLANYPRLDVIVVMVGASDILRWLEQGAPPERPAAPLTDGQLFSRNPGMTIGDTMGTTGLAIWSLRWRDRFWLEQYDVASWIGRARRDRANALAVRDECPPAEIVIQAFRDQMASVIHRAREAADRVLVVGQPWFEKAVYTPAEEALLWNGAIGQAYKGTVTEFFSTRVICDLMGQIDVAAAEVAAREGAEYLRLQGLIPPSAEYFIDHFHGTPRAAGRIGDLVADSLLAGASTTRTSL